MSMETSDAEKMERWFRIIKLDKYGAVCRGECISGRALLLMASKSVDELVRVLNLKKGPKTILMDNLQKPMLVFDKGKPQMPSCSEATIEKLSVEELCNWLKELGIPENSLQEAENEEIDGSSFLLLSKNGELRDCLKLKIGPWIILENERSLHLERSGDRSGEVLTAAVGQTVVKHNFTSKTEVLEESREPEAVNFTSKAEVLLQSREPEAVNDPSIKTSREIPPEKEKKLSLLRKALHLEIESQTDSGDQECLVRSIFVKRGRGVNALEKLFTFIVILKEEFVADNPSKLWRKIREKIHEWIKLLTKENRAKFRWNDGSESFLQMPSKENVFYVTERLVRYFLTICAKLIFNRMYLLFLSTNNCLNSSLFTGMRRGGRMQL